MSSSTSDLEDIFSDESSFYGKSELQGHRKYRADLSSGDDDEQARLEQLAATYDPEPFWSEIHPRLLSTAQHELRSPSESIKPEPISQDDTWSRTALSLNQRGSKESISSFLARLPPSKTSLSDAGPWIWARNTNQPFKEGDTAAFVRKGTDLLHSYEEEAARLRAAHEKSGAKTTAGLTRKLNPLRKTLEHDILTAARETGVTSGKWMLFPPADKVDSVWQTVVTALDEGKLGNTAKVATDDGSRQARLICVYTDDFGDKEDVKRVLRALAEKELVNAEWRPIYYKCDAYTHLDIKSSNDYGLKASMFSSRDVLSGKI